MNVSIQHLGPCKKLLRVEVDVETVQAEVTKALKTLQQRAQLPGFRPGKAPTELVLKAFGPRLDGEVKERLINDAYRKALEQEKLRPVTHPDIEEEPWERTQPLRFTATVETEAEFELPDYKNLPVQRDTRTVTDEDITRAIEMLRDQKATYLDLSRAVQADDYVVVNYTGTCEGKPITDFAPTARGLTSQSNFWLKVDPKAFIPGFTDALIGAQAGEKRTVNITFPADFVTAELAGKAGVYEVEIVQVKERQLPAIDDAFAQGFGAKDLAALRTGVSQDLANELAEKQKRQVRDQLVTNLLSRVNFDLPESLVQHETRSAVYDIVKANQERGVPKTAIDQHKDEIYNSASSSAKDRVKAALVLGRIAEKEGIAVTNDELTRRVLEMAAHYQVKPEKLVKQLQEQGAVGRLRQQILEAKVLDILELYAKVEEAPAAS